MLDGLDEIDWGKLTHAYGSAADVPRLIRDLRTTPSQGFSDGSPLSELFSNIWHQGTVYEATAFAVPFLIELVQSPLVPDRTWILMLLASIAEASSYHDKYGNRPKKPDFDEIKSRELNWVAYSHRAVEAGFYAFSALAEDESADLRLAAAHVLACLPGYSNEVAQILCKRRKMETATPHRSGLLLLLGKLGHQSNAVIAILTAAMQAGDEAERCAAAIALAKLLGKRTPKAATDHLMTLAADEGEVAELFNGLPWDYQADFDLMELIESAQPKGREALIEQLIQNISSGARSAYLELLRMAFPQPKKIASPGDLSPTQMRVLKIAVQAIETGGPITSQSMASFGLPNTRRDLRELAAGRTPASPDTSVPVIADPAAPSLAIRPDALTAGQVIVHRTLGRGTVISVHPGEGKYVRFLVEFEEDGKRTLMLPRDGSPIVPVNRG